MERREGHVLTEAGERTLGRDRAAVKAKGFDTVDRLYDERGEVRFTVAENNAKAPFDFPPPGPGWTELFGGRTSSRLEPGQAILYVCK